MIDLSPMRFTEPSGPTLLEFGGVIVPPLGAPRQRVDRAGDRWSWRFITPWVPMEAEGRQWSALLTRAKKVGARVPVIQQGLRPRAYGSPLLKTATLSGRFLPLKGLQPGIEIGAGQWLNVFDADGNGYLDQVATRVMASAAGEATVEIQNLLRAPLAVDSRVELVKPTIEGDVEGVVEWPVQLNGTTRFEFTVTEVA